MAERTYGEIPGYPVGSTFANRTELAESGVHRPNQAGICGGRDGAESIVVSGGYGDDEDLGDELFTPVTAATTRQPSAKLRTRSSPKEMPGWREASLKVIRSE